jgi:hypothetical protein
VAEYYEKGDSLAVNAAAKADQVCGHLLDLADKKDDQEACLADARRYALV